MTLAPVDAKMLDVFQGFVHELRTAGLPVSMTENLDAMRAVEFVSFGDREALKTALSSTLVKHVGHQKVFETVFEVYFSMFSPGVDDAGDAAGEGQGEQDAWEQMRAAMEGGGAMGDVSNEELAEMLLDALMNMDTETLRMLASAAVARFAGMEPGRPVGGAYYLYRTLRQLDAEGLVAKMMQRGEEQNEIGQGSFDERLAKEDYEGRLKVLKDMIEAEIRRRLVADRGVEAMARTLRKPLPEDVDFMHASREEMQQLQRAIYPLTRALAARLAQRRRHRNRGHLDFRQTVRHSMQYGGVPVEPKFKRPRPSKPEIMVVADISGLSGVVRALHAPVRVRDAERVLEGALVGLHRRCGRGHALLRRGRRHRRGDPAREHRGRRCMGRRPLGLRPRVRDLARAPHP